ncbi:hypothetical protein EUTSA_v10000650mg [Eutrema salsugineum]|uniref:NAD-dependent epimerase/dehydratase domain-containing protein n=1 Tax=Eutrema salsugineum TaxID=72664 RepID=V4L7I8_EUTSA|nr:hypothetical protein EUTSA_v10000650mg [Eutrema salsugineum]
MELWHAMAKTQTERAAWALAMDRMVNMVSVNPGFIVGPSVAQYNSRPTMSYLKGAAQMYESGVLAYVDVEFVADVHIRAFEDTSACDAALKLVEILSPLIPMPARYEKEMQGSEVYEERLRNKKLNKLVEAGSAC